MFPLVHLKVLDFSRLLPGPYCSLMLADLGADVVKIEDAQSGDYLRWMPPQHGDLNVAFAWLHRGKRSVCLNLRHPEGQAAARALAAKADVLLESYRPGVMASMGLAYEQLENPRLVYASLTGYGHGGPLSKRAGHDINYMARSGAGSLTGTRDGHPVVNGLQVADLGGALSAVVSILAAVAGRERGGSGAHLDIALADAALSLVGMQAAEALFTGRPPAPGEGLLAGSVPCYRHYRCGDGRWLAVGAIEPKFWALLCQTLDLPDLGGDGMAQGDRRAHVEALLEARFATRARDEWMALFEGVDCCVDPVLDLNEALASEQARARRMAIGVGGLTQPGCPALPLDGAPAPAAPLGAHTREALLEAGLTRGRVEDLIREGAAVAPSESSQHGSAAGTPADRG